jgi:hypothetical protein
MNLSRLNYAQMSTLRDILREEQYRLWDNYLPNMSKDATMEDLQDAYNILIIENRNPWCREGVIGTILDMFEECEKEVQEAMKQL